MLEIYNKLYSVKINNIDDISEDNNDFDNITIVTDNFNNFYICYKIKLKFTTLIQRILFIQIYQNYS